jgi:hypothetical protein
MDNVRELIMDAIKNLDNRHEAERYLASALASLTAPNPQPVSAALEACDTIEHILAKYMMYDKDCLIANIKLIRQALAILSQYGEQR